VQVTKKMHAKLRIVLLNGGCRREPSPSSQGFMCCGGQDAARAAVMRGGTCSKALNYHGASGATISHLQASGPIYDEKVNIPFFFPFQNFNRLPHVTIVTQTV